MENNYVINKRTWLLSIYLIFESQVLKESFLSLLPVFSSQLLLKTARK